MEILGALNSPLMYLLCGGTLLFVLIYALRTAKKVRSRAIEIGVSPVTLNKIRKSTILLALVPSLGAAVGFIALVPFLGVPWSSLRSGILGGRGYELMSANMAAGGMGYTLETLTETNLPAVVNVMYVMSICILPSLIILVIFGGKVTSTVERLIPKNNFGKIVSGCLMLNLLCIFIPDTITRSNIHFIVFLTSLVISLLLVLLYKKTHWSWIRENSSLICLILGMSSGVLYEALLL